MWSTNCSSCGPAVVGAGALPLRGLLMVMLLQVAAMVATVMMVVSVAPQLLLVQQHPQHRQSNPLP